MIIEVSSAETTLPFIVKLKSPSIDSIVNGYVPASADIVIS